MWLPFLHSIRYSKHNGLIVVNKKGEVLVGGIKQTSERYDDLWRDAFAHSEELLTTEVTKVLLLGLAGGGALMAIHDAYPNALVTAVEFDTEMVTIAKQLHKDKPYPFPNVLIADAKEALLHTNEQYDLILVDIFTGIRTSPHVSDDSFWPLVAGCLTPGGVAILNVAIESTRIYIAQNHFKKHLAWQYDTNTFCALANS